MQAVALWVSRSVTDNPETEAGTEKDTKDQNEAVTEKEAENQKEAEEESQIESKDETGEKGKERIGADQSNEKLSAEDLDRLEDEHDDGDDDTDLVSWNNV